MLVVFSRLSYEGGDFMVLVFVCRRGFVSWVSYIFSFFVFIIVFLGLDDC